MGEAGQPNQTDQTPPAARRPTSIIAIIGLLAGMVGLFIYGALPCGIVAIILGIFSHIREKTALAWIPLILGIIDIVTGLLIFYFFHTA